MTKKKTSFLPKVEVLIILVFFASFMAWAISKCDATKKSFQDDPVEETTSNGDEIPTIDSLNATATAEPNNAFPSGEAPQLSTNTPTLSQPTVSQKPTYSKLYVTIDGLKMRTGPSLDSTVILQMKLFEQVDFLNEFTDSTYQINLGYEMADEPWFKIQHRGRSGWVYGAGVNFYKKKREGAFSGN
ncbi:MAG: SH3 domain-containing protein [Saprospiraceae bacterium]